MQSVYSTAQADWSIKESEKQDSFSLFVDKVTFDITALILTILNHSSSVMEERWQSGPRKNPPHHQWSYQRFQNDDHVGKIWF